MDITTVNPSLGVIRLPTQAVPLATSAPGSNVPAPTTSPTRDSVSAAVAANIQSSDTDSKAIAQSYEAAIQQIVASFKNTYAVSDNKFSIFKDAAGQYITRYVSLRDGSVTYIPKPSFVKSASTAPTGLAITA